MYLVKINAIIKNKQIERENFMEIYLAPNWNVAKQINSLPDATVEAEYGDHVLKGRLATLAHHHKDYKNCKAPCNADVEPISPYSTIVISHIDLDTIGGIMALMGEKPDDKQFWSDVEFIDLNGPHRINDISIENKKRMEAYWAWSSENNIFPRLTSIADVTELVKRNFDIIKKILENDNHLIAKGNEWRQLIDEKVDRCLVEENEMIRIFKTKGVSCKSSYFSKKYKRNIPITLTYNERAKDITLATCSNTINAEEIMQSLFGSLAGGRESIAKTPRGKKVPYQDFLLTIEKVKSQLNIEKKATG